MTSLESIVVTDKTTNTIRKSISGLILIGDKIKESSIVTV